MTEKVSFIALLIVTHFSFVVTEGIQCGQPGRPVNGTVSPVGKAYFPGEKVTYSCLETFVLFGEESRTCLKNGTWSNTVPYCDFNLAKGKRTLQSATLWSYLPSLAVDGNKDTCSFTPKGPDSRWWQVHLGHKFNVVTIGVTISPGSFQEFTIFVIELLTNNKALYKQCTEFKGVFQTHKRFFKCNDGLGHPGQYVYIRDDREEEQYFGLCEVEVFSFRERIPCGDPEIPVNGIVKREGEDRAVYSCERGHTFEGDTALTCSSKGEWQGLLPKCIEMKCSPPNNIENGYFEILTPRAEHVLGAEIKYECNPGYSLRGPFKRVCEHGGNWSAEAPVCQAITCGDPLVFENTKSTFLNTSNQRTSIVVYTCVDGFKLHPDNKDTVTSCLESGFWQPINVTCVPYSNKLEALVRESGARSLDHVMPSPRSSSNTPHLVVTLAIVAGILAAGMIVFGVLLLRRRVLSNVGSLSPLVVRSHANGTNPNPKSEDRASGGSNMDVGSEPYTESMRKPTNHFHTNLLQGIAHLSYTPSVEEHSPCPVEPPYEQVRSDHSYETLRKKNHLRVMDEEDASSLQDTNYESVSSDKESVGYETVANPKEPGYETVANPKDPGYETVTNTRDPGYEVVMDSRDPGYEVVKEALTEKESGYEVVHDDIPEPGYEIVRNDSKHIHGYETLKPKLPPRDKSEVNVPDILQDISSDKEQSLKEHGDDVAKYFHGGKEIPAEILALYAKVDKTKKNRKLKALSAPSSPPLPANHPVLNSKSYSKSSLESFNQKGDEDPQTEFESHPSQKTRATNMKINSLNIGDNTRSLSPPVSLRSATSSPTSSLRGSLRPLPPLPK